MKAFKCITNFTVTEGADDNNESWLKIKPNNSELCVLLKEKLSADTDRVRRAVVDIYLKDLDADGNHLLSTQ